MPQSIEICFTRKEMTKKKEVAPFWKRAVAGIIDGMILIAARSLVKASFGNTMDDIFSSVLSFGYAPFMVYQYQATLGKMAMGTKIVSEDGKKLQIFQVLLREWVGKFISALFLLLGFLWALFDAKRQTWHDKIAGTLVVKS